MKCYILILKYRAVVLFGLNALSGRTTAADGSAVGAWNSSDAEFLMRYSVNKGYTIHGWELGKNYMFPFSNLKYPKFNS